MSDSDSFEDDDFLQEAIEKTSAINRKVNESVVTHIRPVQRTLTGERLEHEDGLPARYEEIRREIEFLPTHHEMNKENLDRYIYPSNFEVRDYQYDIIFKALFKNLLCAIPTGMGKTFVASTVMLNFYRWFKKGKIIFMAPTRPLVAQQIQACLGVTDIPSNDTAILLDKSRKNRPEIWQNKRVFFTTPQVVENDLKSGILNPKDIICLVIDEAHRARGNYAYTNVVQFIDRFNTSFRVLALTATPAADIEGVQEVVKNLHISAIEIRTEESLDIVKYMKRKETVRINCDMNSEMFDIVDLLGQAIESVLKRANESNIYDVTDPSKINAFIVMQKSRALLQNPSIPEGVKWNHYFTLQTIGYVGQMLRRLRIYGVRTFYSYFQNKVKEFRTKWDMGKSTNRIAQPFYYHTALKKIEDMCDNLVEDKMYVSHPKIEHMVQELTNFFEEKEESRVIIFTELRESALEIVKCLDHVIGDKCKPHIFIGQARGKEGFDEEEYKRKHSKKGRGKQNKLDREERERELEEERQRQKTESAAERSGSRTGTSEEAQIQGMNQKTQKELIKQFKKGKINVLVATSIGEEGLDIGEVDLIICYDSTGSPIKNIQRMGRTGRKRDGKVILLLSGSEESKFNQSMEEYASVQRQIARNELELSRSDRIIPANVVPKCIKTLIEIPEDNLIIAGGEDDDEVIKYATQAMLGKNLPKSKASRAAKKTTKKATKKTFQEPTPKITKRFFMPSNVEAGFVNSSTLVRKIGGGASSANSSKSEVSKDASISLVSDDEETDQSKEATDTSLNLDKLFSSPNKSSSRPSSSRKAFIKPLITVRPIPKSLQKELDGSSRLEAADGSEDDDEIEILDFKMPSPVDESSFTKDLPSSTQKRKSSNLQSSPSKQRKLQGSSNAGIDSLFLGDGDETDQEKTDARNALSDNDSLDLMLEGIRKDNEKVQEPTKVNISDEDAILISDSDEDGSEDSLDRVLEDAKLENRSSLGVGESSKPLHMKILNFEAYEDEELEDDQESLFTSYEAPLREASLAMNKQFEKDPAYILSDPGSSSTSKPYKNIPRGKPNKDQKITRPDTILEHQSIEEPKNKIDIASLLKESHQSRKLSSLKSKAIDLSSIRSSQFVNLDSQPLEDQPREPTKMTYLAQRDKLYENSLDESDGLLTEEQYNEFFTVYYTPDVVAIDPNPSISAKRDVFGKLGSSVVSRRFRQFIKLCGPKGEKKLNKLITDLETDASKNLDDKASGIIVDDQNHNVTKTIDTSSSVQTKTPSGGITGTLLSDDDEEFMNL